MLANYQLTVPNTVASPDMVRGFVQRLASSAGLDEAAAQGMAEAAGLAAEYVVRFSYPENRADEIQASCSVSADTLTFSLRDHGLPRVPLDGAVEDDEAPLVEKLRAALDGLDGVQWNLLGYGGKELRFQKKLPGEPSQDVLARAETLRQPTTAAPVDESEYVIRRFQEADAPAIAELVYRAYALTYDDEDYYYPARIVAENNSGAMLSVVAAHPDGEIVGHYALERRDMPGIYEGTSAVVNAEHRGRHLMERMRAAAIDEGRAENFKGLIFLPWTVHVFSQKANEHFGAFLVGINLNDSAPVAIKGYETESLQHRVSTMLYFTPLQKRQPCVQHVPAHLRDMVGRILCPLDGTVAFEDGGQTQNLNELFVKESPHDQLAEITVESIGGDTEAELSRELHRLLVNSHAETVLLNLPMSDPACPALTAACEAMGFGFIGVGPNFTKSGDSLRFALIDALPDPAHVHVFSDLGRAILDFALAEQRRLNPV